MCDDVDEVVSRGVTGLVAETVEGSSLPLEGVDDVERGDGLSLWKKGRGGGMVRRCERKTDAKSNGDSLACSV